jgi:hypothetical protein
METDGVSLGAAIFDMNISRANIFRTTAQSCQLKAEATTKQNTRSHGERMGTMGHLPSFPDPRCWGQPECWTQQVAAAASFEWLAVVLFASVIVKISPRNCYCQKLICKAFFFTVRTLLSEGRIQRLISRSKWTKVYSIDKVNESKITVGNLIYPFPCFAIVGSS